MTGAGTLIAKDDDGGDKGLKQMLHSNVKMFFEEESSSHSFCGNILRHLANPCWFHSA